MTLRASGKSREDNSADKIASAIISPGEILYSMNYQGVFKELIIKSDKLLDDYLRLLTNVDKKVTKTSKSLNIIKSELLAARKRKIYDPTAKHEIQACSNSILSAFTLYNTQCCSVEADAGDLKSRIIQETSRYQRRRYPDSCLSKVHRFLVSNAHKIVGGLVFGMSAAAGFCALNGESNDLTMALSVLFVGATIITLKELENNYETNDQLQDEMLQYLHALENKADSLHFKSDKLHVHLQVILKEIQGLRCAINETIDYGILNERNYQDAFTKTSYTVDKIYSLQEHMERIAVTVAVAKRG